MVNQCVKCMREFYSSYHLEKHLNRKIPCTVTLKCDRCNKIYDREIDLERHKNRKYPCKIVLEIKEKSDLEIQLEIEKEKTKRLEKEMAIDLENKLAILEKQKQNEIEVIREKNKKELAQKDKQKEKELEKIEKQNEKELAQKEKQMNIEKERAENEIRIIQEKAKHQLEKSKAVELLKTERKEKTSQVINNNIINNNITNVINYINETQTTDNKVPIQDLDTTIRLLKNEKALNCTRIYDNNSDPLRILQGFLKRLLKNPKSPLNNVIYYNRSLDDFIAYWNGEFGLELRITDYIKDIWPKLLLFLRQRCNMISEIIDKMCEDGITNSVILYHKEKYDDFKFQTTNLNDYKDSIRYFLTNILEIQLPSKTSELTEIEV